MSGRTFAAILLVIILGIGATALGVTAYNAGVTAGLAQNVAAEGGSVVVAPGLRGRAVCRLGLGLGPRVRVLRLLRLPVLPVHRVRADPGRVRLGSLGPRRTGWLRAGRLRPRLGQRWPRRLERPGPRGPRRAPPDGRHERHERHERRRRPARAARPSPADPPPHRRPRAVPRAPSPPPRAGLSNRAGASAPSSTMRRHEDDPRRRRRAEDRGARPRLPRARRLRRRGSRPTAGGARGGRVATEPDLVVLDLGLPGIDGLDVTRAIRRDSSLPIDHAHGPRRRARQAARARARRGRLPDEAVQPARARRPGPGRPPPGRRRGRAGRRRRAHPRRRRDARRARGCGSSSAAGRSS